MSTHIRSRSEGEITTELTTFDQISDNNNNHTNNNNVQKAGSETVNGRTFTWDYNRKLGAVFLVVAAILFTITATLGAGAFGGGNMYYISAGSGLIGIFLLCAGVKKIGGYSKEKTPGEGLDLNDNNDVNASNVDNK